jgi:hypothetical protein
MQNAELVTESQDLGSERGSRSLRRGKSGEHGYQHLTHGSRRRQHEAARATISIATELLVGTGS